MGQYYNPVILKKNWKTAKQPVKMTLYSWDFNNGLKLMEHSWVGNSFVMSMMYILNKFKGLRLAWVGDYADEKITRAYPNGVSLYNKAYELTERGEGHKLYEELKNSIPEYEKLPTYRYIINRTKKEYVRVPKYNSEVWQVHPLPLLCADGNQRGGGDYWGKSKSVGRWAYDVIEVSNDQKDIHGCKLIRPVFKEDY